MLSHPASASQTSVLIVDESEDSREVLQTALTRRGVATLATAGARQGMELAREHHPQLIVLDMETVAQAGTDVRQHYDDATRSPDTSVVLLGRVHGFAPSLPRDRVVSKPYHYAPLLRTIERVLASRKAA